MQKITCTSSSFEGMRSRNTLYVDKTEYLWKMVDSASTMFFLSRPRRFGKSLTVSTLKALFEGKRELFKGLAIDSKLYDWKSHPVIQLNLSSCAPHSADEFKGFLEHSLLSFAEQFELDVNIDREQLSASFSDIIKAVHKKQGPVVILIDEYDKPLLENLTNGKAEEIRDVLSDFYSVLKAEDTLERFVFLTGVTKFCQVSIFSKLNNLKDISMDAIYATMLGYTQEELEANFSEWIADAESMQALPHDRFMAKIKEWYDGFRFHRNAESVYNPVSIANFLDRQGEFSNYWFSTGTPTFLMEVIKKTRFDFEKALKEPVEQLAFSAYEIGNIDPLTLLMQTGYMTIKGSVEKRGQLKYWLDFPNREVKDAFVKYLLEGYSGIRRIEQGQLTDRMLDSMEEGLTEDFIDVLKTFFAEIPYDIQLKEEKYYQSLVYTLFKVLGVQTEAEARTNNGRIDAVAVLEKHAYIMEFKVDKPVDEAMAQIRDREYYQRYRHSGRQIHLLGISIRTKERNVSEWKEEIDAP